MSVYINKDKISKVYFGGDNIVKIYKGRDLVFGDDGGGGDGQLELTFAKSVSRGTKIFKYNGTYYTTPYYYSKGSVLAIDDFPSLTLLSFNDYNNYASIKVLPKIDTSNVTDMCYMFRNCSSLTSLDVRNLNTSKVTDMSSMFDSCSSLTSLDVTNFNTSNVTNMLFIFRDCSNLTSLDVTNFNTSKVMNMYGMFAYCSKLTSLDVRNLNTSNVTNMRYMFTSCASLTNLDLSSFNTSKVTDMYQMFYNCSNLTSLDVSNFNTSKVTNMSYMFDSCPVLSNIIFGEGWGKSSTSGLTLDLSTCNADNKYQFTDETWNSLLTLYDRATNGLPTMTIKIKSSSNFPSGWVSKMTAKGYTISYG